YRERDLPDAVERKPRHRALLTPAIAAPPSRRKPPDAFRRRSNWAGAFELGAVHQAAGRGVKGVAAVHRAAIVPPHEIADLPFLGPGELVLDHVSPELVEQRLALGDRQADDIGVDTAAEEQRLLAGLGMSADHRLARARHLGDI